MERDYRCAVGVPAIRPQGRLQRPSFAGPISAPRADTIFSALVSDLTLSNISF
jgi:hypothetical protein